MKNNEFRYDYGLGRYLAQNNICHFFTYSGTGENEEITYYIKTADPNQLLVFAYKRSGDGKIGSRFASMFYLFRSMEEVYEDCIEDLLTGREHFTFMNVCEDKNVFDFNKGKIVPSPYCTNEEEEEGSEEE